MKKLAALAIAGIATSTFAQDALLGRRYREGEALSYRMKGIDNGRRYEVRATGVVKRDDAGRYFEEYAWSDFVVDGSPVSLPAESTAFRQVLSLEPALTPAIPDLRRDRSSPQGFPQLPPTVCLGLRPG